MTRIFRHVAVFVLMVGVLSGCKISALEITNKLGFVTVREHCLADFRPESSRNLQHIDYYPFFLADVKSSDLEVYTLDDRALFVAHRDDSCGALIVSKRPIEALLEPDGMLMDLHQDSVSMEIERLLFAEWDDCVDELETNRVLAEKYAKKSGSRPENVIYLCRIRMALNTFEGILRTASGDIKVFVYDKNVIVW
ncbi:hypothetical protein NNA36_13525 [Shimia sp. CNT1-13L.2]|uniref:hypothetical protein n=1 Tax=Shimia sp. CNT1-13L.2 TaxID=2959663 RepID=UPI0020CD8568|nr:hypothetical protein [Shimia sp. CNT1-13L.2]MCP9482985.1 hypothetical protein [Shimia sp. CNT1-13L.2]